MALRAVGRLVTQRLSRGASRNFRSNAVPSKNVQDKVVLHGSSKKILKELDELTDKCLINNNLLQSQCDARASYINMWTVYFSAGALYFGQCVRTQLDEKAHAKKQVSRRR